MLRKLIFLLAAAALLVVGFGFIGGRPVTAAQSGLPNLGSLRVVNALVGIGPVDVFVDNQRITYGLQPKQATPYLFVSVGRHQVVVRRGGADNLSIPIADMLVDITSGESITAIAYQKVFAPSDGDAPSIEQAGAFFLVSDDRSPIPLGRVRLTAVHLAVGTPQRISIGYRSGEALLYQISLEKPFGTIDVDADAQTLAVIDADSPNLRLLANYGEASFYANTLYTLIVVPSVLPSSNSSNVGQGSATPQMFIISAPIDPPTENGIHLRIVHAAHDTAVLDIYIDERLVAKRVSYSRVTEYLGLANYGHTITLRRFGDPATAPPLGRATFTITPENTDQAYWTLLLVNSNDANSGLLQTSQGTNAPVILNTPGGQVTAALIPDNISATQSNYARLRVINAADGVGALGLFTLAYPPAELPPGVKPTPTPIPTPGTVREAVKLVDPTLFGGEANDNEVPVGLYDELNFVPDGSINRIQQLRKIQLVSGIVYTFVVMGSPAGNPPVTVITLEDYGFGQQQGRQYDGVVLAASGNMRATPSTSAGIVITLKANDKIEVLGRSADNLWLRVRYTDPATARTSDGWISVQISVLITRLGTPVQIDALPTYTGN